MRELILCAQRLPRLVPRPAVTAMRGASALVTMPAASMAADDAVGIGMPDDSFLVGFAILVLLLTGLLNLSLGDVIADEAQLPSSVNLINKNRARRSSFIKGKK